MARAKGGLSKTFVWIILGLLIVGLAGFGATNFSGTVRSVGSVGDSDIPLQDYARTLQNEIRAFEAQTGQPLPFQQARDIGLTDQVLAQVVVATALDDEARRIGLSIGDERLARELRQIDAFNGSDGQFNREAYAFALQNAGLSEAEFEEDLRADSGRALLQAAVVAGVAFPDTYVDTLLAHIGERRAYSYAALTGDLLTDPLPEPTDADLTAWYEANIDRFTRPETRLITYAWLTPDMIVDEVEVDQAALRAAYDERRAEFNLPERRLVERLVFADDAAARTAADRIASGDATFEALVAERGLALADTDMGDVTADDLGAAAELVFAAQPGSVAGPAPSSLGPALYRVNAVLPSQNTSFEEAEPDLRDALAMDRARRVIDAQIQDFDDRLAAGATLEELAAETDMRLGQIDFNDLSEQDIAGYDAFRSAALAATEQDFPAIDDLGDGGIFALRLDGIEPPAPRPFEDVADAVSQGWVAEQRVTALAAAGEALQAQLAEGRTFEALGLTVQSEPGITRNGALTGQVAELRRAAFEMEPGAVQVVTTPDGAYLLRLDEIIAVDMSSEEAQLIAGAVQDQAVSDVANDLFRALASDIQSRAGVTINQEALNAVHANFQ
ncbi:peptidyl-prolyl cis-trans isomerase [Thalassococcus sp. CAU 1522]|uniref:Peptidyl-prolyl cis-trans isomerase n=1 Tax=Thalassococcus arenae TaxID=2851652 RepID=A0ABS6NAC6_9RHOB|nr:peptidylprolyl isomerase [Thalassococcus arenae]MBV2360983.1 peptidyl-prolyl cis-trans isomerase [Thalassococcus arenae]